MKDIFFGYGGAYNKKRDGPLEQYLETHDGISCFPLFHGYRMYQELWNKGYLLPNISVIRLMWNVGKGDEHFLVLEDKRLQGLEANMHSGRPGIHDPKKILKSRGPCWEANPLSHNPQPRTN